METIQEKAQHCKKQLDALKENKIKPADIDLEQKTKSDVKSESVEVKQKICQLQYNFILIRQNSMLTNLIYWSLRTLIAADENLPWILRY